MCKCQQAKQQQALAHMTYLGEPLPLMRDSKDILEQYPYEHASQTFSEYERVFMRSGNWLPPSGAYQTPLFYYDTFMEGRQPPSSSPGTMPMTEVSNFQQWLIHTWDTLSQTMNVFNINTSNTTNNNQGGNG